MADLGRPANFAGAEGVVEWQEIRNYFKSGPSSGGQADVYITDDTDYLWRLRFLSIFGDASGTVGTMALTLQGLTAGSLSGIGWPNGGPLVAAADAEVRPGESYHYSWNTEISDNYSNLDNDFGRIFVGGMPLLYIPKNTTISIMLSAKGGYDGQFNIDGGHLQIERFLPEQVTGGPLGAGGVYLLPYGG